jgi:hypothetical protein
MDQERRSIMHAIRATWTNGQIVPAEPVDWPEGSQLLVDRVVRNGERIGITEEEWRDDDDAIADWEARISRHPGPRDPFLDLLAGQRAVCIGQARLNVGRFQKRIFLEEPLRRIPGGQHPEHMIDCHPHAADDRLSAKDCRVHCDALEQFISNHRLLLPF